MGRAIGLSGAAMFLPIRIGLHALDLTGRAVRRLGSVAVRLNHAAEDNAEFALSIETAEIDATEVRLHELVSSRAG